MTLYVYRIWKDQTWDRVPVEVDQTIVETQSLELIEAHTCQRAWLKLLSSANKPIQIGLLLNDPENRLDKCR